MVTVSKFYSRKIREGAAPSNPGNVDQPDAIPPVLNPPGSGVPSYITLSDTKDGNYLGKNGFVPVVTTENGLKLEPLPQVAENGLISGGIVQWSGVGYIFNVSGAFYRIGGVLYESPAVQITLDAPDATNDRIDVFAVDINSAALDITGTPSGSPVKPQIDPSTQLELTSVIVTASTTEPTLTEEVIYDENTEWTGSSTGTGTANFASTNDPYQGTVSVETTNIQNAFYIEFDNGSTIDISGFQTLGFQLKLKATMGANQNLIGIFLDGSGNPASSSFSLAFDKSSLNYQFVGLVLSGLAIVEPNIRYLRIVYIRTSGSVTHSGYFLDILKMEGGINPPVTANNFLNLTDTPSSYVGQASKVVSVKADETGLEFTTPSGGGGTDSNAVHYNVADGKNGADKSQARANIGSTSSAAQIVATTGTINDLAITSNCVIFTGAGTVTLNGVVAGEDGQEIELINRTGNNLTIANNNVSSSGNNRFYGGIIVADFSSVRFKYSTNILKWLNSTGAFFADYTNGVLGVRTFNPVGVNSASISTVAIQVRSNSGSFWAARFLNSSGSSMLDLPDSRLCSFASGSRLGVNRVAISNVALTAQCTATNQYAFGLYTFAGSNGAFVNNTMDWTSIGGAGFGVTAGGTPTARVDIRGRGTTTGTTLLLEDSAGTDNVRFIDNGQVLMLRLPTSSAGLAAGSLWNDSGTVKIV